MWVITVKKWFFPASCIGPFIIIRESNYHQEVLNHEYIHYLQQKSMLFIGAYILYALEFICKLFYYKFHVKNAYINVSFEREAHAMQPMIGYCGYRKPYAHLKCIYMKDSLRFKLKPKALKVIKGGK